MSEITTPTYIERLFNRAGEPKVPIFCRGAVDYQNGLKMINGNHGQEYIEH